MYVFRNLTLALALTAMATAVAGQDRQTTEVEKSYTLGVVLFEGFELLDAMGPLEMFGNVGPRLKIATVAEKQGPVTSAQGIKVVADHGFDNCPELDIILVPGGRGVIAFNTRQPSLDWIRERSKKAQIVTSVCNGADILATAGLLDGYKATTNKMFFDFVAGRSQDVEWVRKARWVDSGDRITSSGVSAGMDMALSLIQRLFGEDTAVGIANATEYEWHRDPTWDPFADLYMKK